MNEAWIDSRGGKLQADLYIPSSQVKFPSICMVPGGSGKNPPTEHKGRVAPLRAYNGLANELSEAGFIVVLFDARGQGRSGGLRSYSNIIEDIGAVIDYLSGHDSVDSDRIGLLGICLGGCLGICRAIDDKRIKSIATWGTRVRYDELCDTEDKRRERIEKWKERGVRSVNGDWENVKNTEDFIHMIKQPILIAGGSEDIDHFKPQTQIGLLHKARNSENALLTVIRGAKHIVFEDDESFCILTSTMIEWFKKTL